MSIPKYFIQNGLRKVTPYYQTNSTYTKGHWIGKKVLDLLSGEFKVRSEEYYQKQISNGDIVVIRDGQRIMGDDLHGLTMKNKDILETTSHKHEANVIAFDKFRILHQDSDIIVIDKPSSIPVHPTGRFYYNSVTETLKLQENIFNLFPCYRLDKLISGVFILCKNASTAGEMQSLISENLVTKEYLARVKGKFPDGVVVCNEPVSHVVPKMGYTYGKGSKKTAITVFERIKYNEELDESIVSCKPQTGRTHQIRIHLNYLKHPIINDPLYGPSASKIRNKITNSKEISKQDFEELVKEFNNDYKNLETDHFCDICGYQTFKDEDPASLVLYLHASKYSSKDGEWSYGAPDPEWCQI